MYHIDGAIRPCCECSQITLIGFWPTGPLVNVLTILKSGDGRSATNFLVERGPPREEAARVVHEQNDGYSLALLFRPASSSFLMSWGDNFGRSTVNAILLNVPVKVNGHW